VIRRRASDGQHEPDIDWDDLDQRIRRLIDAYVASPEGEGEGACTLMARLAVCVADVIPMAIRKRVGKQLTVQSPCRAELNGLCRFHGAHGGLPSGSGLPAGKLVLEAGNSGRCATR